MELSSNGRLSLGKALEDDRYLKHAIFASVSAACKAVYSESVYSKSAVATQEQRMLSEYAFDLCYKEMGISNAGMVHVVVDLSATDEQICSDFRHWLTAFRQAIGISASSRNISAPSRNFDEREFKGWIDNQVLPYVDLTLWAKVNNVVISQNTLGEALFPHEDSIDTTERIRRTVKPKAEHLLRQETARALQYQCAASSLAENLPAEKDHEKVPENKE